MIAVVVGVLFVFMLLTKFSEKDILLKGNKVYSECTCCFVP